jgi:tRNA A37 N6-isopentenylltransferase MiaA
VLLVVGGTVLVFQSMLWEVRALAAPARRLAKRLQPSA